MEKAAWRAGRQHKTVLPALRFQRQHEASQRHTRSIQRCDLGWKRRGDTVFGVSHSGPREFCPWHDTVDLIRAGEAGGFQTDDIEPRQRGFAGRP